VVVVVVVVDVDANGGEWMDGWIEGDDRG